MLTPITYAIFAYAGGLFIWSTWFFCKDRAVILKQLLVAIGLEALLVIQAISMLILANKAPGEPAGWEVLGYVFTMLILLPAAGIWAFAERTKWSSAVYMLAVITIAFLQWRIIQLWFGV